MIDETPPPAEIMQRPHQPLFADRQNGDLYWQALLHLAHQRKDLALQCASAILSGESNVSVPSIWQVNPSPAISDVFDRLFISAVCRNPQELSDLGLFESIGLKAHNASLRDLSISAMQVELEEAKSNLQMLENFDASSLTVEQNTSLEVCLWELRAAVAEEPFLLHSYYPVRHIMNALYDLSNLLTAFHRLDTAEDCEHYLTRLSRIPEQLHQIEQRIQTQCREGISWPRFSLEKTVQSMAHFVEEPMNLFYQYLAKHCADTQILDRAQRIIDQQVLPAYRSLKNELELMLETTHVNHGVWALPNGNAYYACQLRKETTTDLTPEQVHQLGLQEVSRIQQEIRAALEIEGVNDSGRELGDLLRCVMSDPDFYYPDTEEGRQACLAHYEDLLERSRKTLWPLFDATPQSKVQVIRAPKHEEMSQASAYYCIPSFDGVRAGVFYANLRDVRDHAKFRMPNIAVHEAEPGHHFQWSLQIEQDLPLIRKVKWYGAYGEGWALYTEKLAYEQGFYQTAFEQIGHLQDELLRAARLVVDTGIHSKRWSREEAIDYMMKCIGLSKEGITSEVDRYFVWPGQACSYKIGQLKILELRQKAKDCLGDAFDIRAFHNVVLKCGAVPLDILEQEVERYIANYCD